MTNQEMINEMSKMQRALDDAICKEHEVEFDEEKCILAMIDEIGEFNHEVKSTWCWWKKTQAPIDRDKALEELVDIWHFALSLSYHFLNKCQGEYLFYDDKTNDGKELSTLYFELVQGNYFRLECLHSIGKRFGFTLEDVYEAYKKKNQVNYERLANNY